MKKYWTLERCIEEAKKYSSNIDWRIGSISSQSAAYKNGWIKLCSKHMKPLVKPNGYWTKQRCLDDAKKYNNRTQWRLNSKTAYKKSYENGWLSIATKHMESTAYNHKRLIYAYIFNNTNTNAIYIGLTYNLSNRNNDHFCNRKNNKSSVNKFYKKTGITPKLIKLSDYVDPDSARVLEEKWVNHYRKLNYQILNKAKTGGIGGGVVTWTLERCITEAKKYDNVREWIKKSSGSYNSAWKNGWLSQCYSHMKLLYKPKGYWTLERCITEAKKYDHPSEWHKNSASSETIARRNGWYKLCSEHMTFRKNGWG